MLVIDHPKPETRKSHKHAEVQNDRKHRGGVRPTCPSRRGIPGLGSSSLWGLWAFASLFVRCPLKYGTQRWLGDEDRSVVWESRDPGTGKQRPKGTQNHTCECWWARQLAYMTHCPCPPARWLGSQSLDKGSHSTKATESQLAEHWVPGLSIAVDSAWSTSLRPEPGLGQVLLPPVPGPSTGEMGPESPAPSPRRTWGGVGYLCSPQHPGHSILGGQEDEGPCLAWGPLDPQSGSSCCPEFQVTLLGGKWSSAAPYSPESQPLGCICGFSELEPRRNKPVGQLSPVPHPRSLGSSSRGLRSAEVR